MYFAVSCYGITGNIYIHISLVHGSHVKNSMKALTGSGTKNLCIYMPVFQHCYHEQRLFKLTL